MPLIDPQLKEILVCPCPHHAELEEDEAASRLRCQTCRLTFSVEDGLPNMLLSDAHAGEDFNREACGAPEEIGATSNGDTKATE
jgi:uncharacterized protein YbaR (Trm112 family)